MRILALTDKVANRVYSPNIRRRYAEVDLVVGCGDLPYYYLEFVATALTAPVAYVYGNHDDTQYTADGRTLQAAEGCLLIDGRVARVNGLLLAGLGGSRRYRPRGKNQYTEFEMATRILRLLPGLLVNRILHGRYLDVLVTHAPPLGIHDGSDLPHTGFRVFRAFMRLFKPRYLIHGHMHLYRLDTTFRTRYRQTDVINAYPVRIVEWEEGTHA